MSVYIPAALQRQVREFFQDRCAYCKTAEWLTVSIFEYEHIIPLSAGGETIFANLCFACPTCNRYKARRHFIRDEATQQAIPLFNPQQQHWDEHFLWSADGTEIISLTRAGELIISALRMNRPQYLRVRRMWVQMNEHPPTNDSLH